MTYRAESVDAEFDGNCPTPVVGPSRLAVPHGHGAGVDTVPDSGDNAASDELRDAVRGSLESCADAEDPTADGDGASAA